MPRLRADCIGSKKLLFAGQAAALVALIGLQSAAYAEQGWELTQYSDYLGAQTVLISKSAIKVTAPKYGVSLMACAPKFDVLGVNDKTHVYYIADYEGWSERFKQQSIDMQKSPSQPDGEAMVANMKTQRILVDADHGGAPIDPEPGRIQHNTVLFVSPDIQTSPKLISLLATVAYVPSHLGFPLRVFRYRRGGRGSTHATEANRSIIWDTRAVKKANVPDSFPIPKGYTRVDTEMALFLGGGSAGMTAALDDDGSTTIPKLTGADTNLWTPGYADDDDDLLASISTKRQVTADDAFSQVRQGKSLKGTQHLFAKAVSAARNGTRVQAAEVTQHAGQWAPGWEEHDN